MPPYRIYINREYMTAKHKNKKDTLTHFQTWTIFETPIEIYTSSFELQEKELVIHYYGITDTKYDYLNYAVLFESEEDNTGSRVPVEFIYTLE